jgi:hypothetical protein
VAEQAIKILEKASLENPYAILKANAIEYICMVYHFFENHIQKSIIEIIYRVSRCFQQQRDFEIRFMPAIPLLVGLLPTCNFDESTVLQTDKIVGIFQRSIDKAQYFFDQTANFRDLGDLLLALDGNGLIEALIQIT